MASPKKSERLGPFAIEGPLGSGGMGEVWAARDTRLGRRVALKFLQEGLVEDPERRRRFEGEARALAALHHPHIGTLFELYEHDGKPVLVMELVEGETLRARLEQGPIPLAEVLTLFVQLSDALVAAHERGIVHRDLKPANLMITPDGRMKVLDFGIAKALAPSSQPTKTTASSDDDETLVASSETVAGGGLIGTLAYMSPEQARGKTVDRGTDVWAFGVVLFEVLTRRPLFLEGTPSETLAAVLEREPEWDALPADLPRPVRRLLQRCLEKKPSDRLRDLGDARLELLDALRVLDGGDPEERGWSPQQGESIPGRSHWQLAERLGEGGFGDVWLAEHDKTGEKRVFKFCPDPDRVRGLKREVVLFRLLRESLGHRDDIARILDWEFDQPPFFLEAEYTEGGDLAQWSEDRGGLSEVPLETRLDLAIQAAEALGAAHGVGVLHKDIKPSNVLVKGGAESPQVVLADFGIGALTDSTLLEGGVTSAGLTQTLLSSPASSGGTPLYMAPEVLEGKPATTRSDLYSLGIVLYQLVAGTFQRAMAPGWERDIDDDLLRADIAACVEGRPELRLSSALDLSQRLRTLEERRAQQDEAARNREIAATAQRRRKWFAIATAAGLLVTAVFGGFALRERSRALQESELRQEAEWQNYVSSIRLADIKLENGELDAARELLESTPEDLRDWEWGYLANLAWPDDYLGRGVLRQRKDFDSVAEMWRGSTPVVVAQIPAPEAPVLHITFGPQGRRLAIATIAMGHSGLQVWDVETERLVCSVEEPLEQVWVAAFAPDGETIVSAGSGFKLFLWDSESCERKQEILLPFRGVTAVSFDPRGMKLLAASSFDSRTNYAGIWNVAGGKQLAFLEDEFGDFDVNTVARFEQEDTVLLTWGTGLARWHAESERTSVLSRPDPKAVTLGVSLELGQAFDSDEQGRLSAWSLQTGQALYTLEDSDGEPFRGLQYFHPAISPAGEILASVSTGGSLLVWSLVEGSLLTSVEQLAVASEIWQRLQFDPTGERLAVVGDRDVVTVLAPAEAKASYPSTLPTHPEEQVVASRYTPEGHALLTTSQSGAVALFDPDTGEESFRIRGHEAAIADARFSPDGRWLLTIGIDDTAVLRDAESGSEVWSRALTAGTILSEGSRILTSFSDRAMNEEGPFDLERGRVFLPGRNDAGLVSLATGKMELPLPSGGFRGEFDPTLRRLLVLGNEDVEGRRARRFGRIVDAESGEILCDLTPPPIDEDESMEILPMLGAWSPDGRSLVIAHYGFADQDAAFSPPRIWDPQECRVLSVLHGQGGTIYTARFAPSGEWIVATSDDRTAWVWDSETGEKIGTFRGHSDLIVEGASINPTSTRVLSHSIDAWVWATDGAELIELTRRQGFDRRDYPGGVTWSPDGLTAVLWQSKGTVHLYRAVPWSNEDLPGDRETPLGERIRMWRDANLPQ